MPSSIVINPLERANVADSLTFGSSVSFIDSEYTGQMKNGFRHGLGKLTYKDGRVYSGAFINNVLHGYGVFVNTMRNSYSGRFKKGEMHEGGIVTTLSGDRFEVQYNEGILIMSQRTTGDNTDLKLATLSEKALEKEQETNELIRNGGAAPPVNKPAAARNGSPGHTNSSPSRPAINARANDTFATRPTKQRALLDECKKESPDTTLPAVPVVEMFVDDEDEPSAAPVVGSTQSLNKPEEVQYADPSELCIIPLNVADQDDYHWNAIQSAEAAKFLTAYGKEGSFLVRTRPNTANEQALAALLSGTVHHFKFDIIPDGYKLGGVMKKTIPLLLAYFMKNKIYHKSYLKEPMPPYIDIVKKIEQLGYSYTNGVKAFKATKSCDTAILLKYIESNR